MEKDLMLFKEMVLNQIGEVELEYNVLVNQIEKIKYYKKNPEKAFLLPDFEIENLYNTRKNRKYSLMIIELYTLIEQAMQSLYKYFINTRFSKGNVKINTVVLIENALDTYVSTAFYIYPLAILRNSILHELLDINKGKEHAIQELTKIKHHLSPVLPPEICDYYIKIFSKKPKRLVSEMLQDGKDYIDSIELRRSMKVI